MRDPSSFPVTNTTPLTVLTWSPALCSAFQTYFSGESYAGQYIPYFGQPTLIVSFDSKWHPWSRLPDQPLASALSRCRSEVPPLAVFPAARDCDRQWLD